MKSFYNSTWRRKHECGIHSFNHSFNIHFNTREQFLSRVIVPVLGYTKQMQILFSKSHVLMLSFIMFSLLLASFHLLLWLIHHSLTQPALPMR